MELFLSDVFSLLNQMKSHFLSYHCNYLTIHLFVTKSENIKNTYNQGKIVPNLILDIFGKKTVSIKKKLKLAKHNFEMCTSIFVSVLYFTS